MTLHRPGDPVHAGDRVGLDIGGTKMLGVRVAGSDPTHVLAEERMPTPRGTEALLDGIAALVEAVDAGGDAPVGVGIPGLVQDGRIFRAGANLPEVLDVDVAARVGDRTGRWVVVDNDATCATHAEFHGGAGAGHTDGVLVTLGTGIGGGLVLDGAVRHGAHGFAGEPGHMLIDPAGPRCPCGRRGCWERFASGSGLGRLGRDAAVAGNLAAAVALAGDAEAVRGEHVVAAARQGDPDAGAVLDEFAWWVAAGVANLIDLLDPSVVVIGGGVVEAADVLLHRIEAAVPDQVLSRSHRPPVEIAAARFGPRAGAIGAAIISGARRPA